MLFVFPHSPQQMLTAISRTMKRRLLVSVIIACSVGLLLNAQDSIKVKKEYIVADKTYLFLILLNRMSSIEVIIPNTAMAGKLSRSRIGTTIIPPVIKYLFNIVLV